MSMWRMRRIGCCRVPLDRIAQPVRQAAGCVGIRGGVVEASEVVEASGHIIDSGILNSIFDTVIRHGGAFEVLEFRIGRTNEEPSLLTMRVRAQAAPALHELLNDLVPLGCYVTGARDALTRPADQEGCAPVDFYSTTNHQTHVRIGGEWTVAEHQRMDAAIVVDGGRAV